MDLQPVMGTLIARTCDSAQLRTVQRSWALTLPRTLRYGQYNHTAQPLGVDTLWST